uniref:Uncharacterized protein n=1 Tax=Chlamydomonas leiostraca TaxID=1034604 RepID=A0A7S0S172_9CHLO|mmetsp:Transcript_37988/g.96089  ORF Transcript_37988/g.96089 Transcript_37988/m.96089 type:complete len:518 (+) Transcript_37988:63-1616(+)
MPKTDGVPKLLHFACVLWMTAKAQEFGAPLPVATAQVTAQAAQCLRARFSGARPDHIKFSQVGEDGVLEAVFGCIGTTTRSYVEFGVEDGAQCSTRWLREHHGFRGLMMDGGHANPATNLQRELIDAGNIAPLIAKHGVPPSTPLDHLTVDIDLNTFWVAAAVLRGGYRPRSLILEFNRNLAPPVSVTALYLPREQWTFPDSGANGWGKGGAKVAAGCYYGASALATAHLAAHFGYELVYVDKQQINLYFVHASALGAGRPYTPGATAFGSIDAAIAASNDRADSAQFAALHAPCPYNVWLEVAPGTNFSAPGWDTTLRPVMLGHWQEKVVRGAGQRRTFYEVEGVSVTQVRQHPETAGPLGGPKPPAFGTTPANPSNASYAPDGSILAVEDGRQGGLFPTPAQQAPCMPSVSPHVHVTEHGRGSVAGGGYTWVSLLLAGAVGALAGAAVLLLPAAVSGAWPPDALRLAGGAGGSSKTRKPQAHDAAEGDRLGAGGSFGQAHEQVVQARWPTPVCRV